MYSSNKHLTSDAGQSTGIHKGKGTASMYGSQVCATQKGSETNTESERWKQESEKSTTEMKVWEKMEKHEETRQKVKWKERKYETDQRRKNGKKDGMKKGNKAMSRSGDCSSPMDAFWIYCIQATRSNRQLHRCRWSAHFTVHRYTCATVLSLH
jgi:cytochrome c556